MTIVAPTGVENKTASRIPSTEVITEKMPAVMITFLKLEQSLIAASAGKTTSAVIKSEPTRFIASTITIAVTTAIIVLYSFTFIPLACANCSSNVTAKILW